MTAPRGTGTKRERRPGVWEIRVAAGTDPVTGRTIQRSVTFHGAEADADTYRVELAGEYAARRSVARAAPLLNVGELLDRWLAADHPWKPSTWSSHRSNARFLSIDKLASTRVTTLTPQKVREALSRWEADGATLSVRAGRFRVLRSAIGWAYDERIIDHHPIRTMRGPGRSEPRRPIPDADVTALFTAASTALLEAVANDTTPGPSSWRRHVAEQDLLLLRLAADTGARRGELAALRFDDLDARTLTIRRAISGTEITTPKSGHGRSLTIGSTTAAIWTRLHDEWSHEARLGPWVFSGHRDHINARSPRGRTVPPRHRAMTRKRQQWSRVNGQGRAVGITYCSAARPSFGGSHPRCAPPNDAQSHDSLPYQNVATVLGMSKTRARPKEKAFTTSDLSRKRKEVMAAARRGTALVRDTDGTVIAMRTSEHVAVQDRLGDLNRILRAVVASLRDAQPSAALLGDVAWLADWPAPNREQFVLDFADTISLSESIGSTEPADAFLLASRPQAPTHGLFDATEAFTSLSDEDRAVLRGERRTA